jgi:TonB family protein
VSGIGCRCPYARGQPVGTAERRYIMRTGPFTLVFFACLLVSPVFLIAQSSPDWPDASYIDEAPGLPILKNVSVDAFDSDSWLCFVSRDDGVATGRSFPVSGGGSAFGVRVDFTRRGPDPVFVYSRRPLRVDGIVKSVSVRVAGRNFAHSLYLIVRDNRGLVHELWAGKLDFLGWKTMRVSLPPASDDGLGGIVQGDSHYPGRSGISILGFRIDCDPMEAYGSFYVYFSDLRAIVEVNQPPSVEVPAAPAAGTKAPAALRPAPAAPDTVVADVQEPALPSGDKPTGPALVLKAIRDAIAAAQSYPAAARRRGLEGVTRLSITVTAGGALEAVRVVASSGSDILDRAATDLATSIFPVANDTGRSVTVEVGIVYKLDPAKP